MLYDLVERVVEAVRWDGEGNAGEGVIRLMGGHWGCAYRPSVTLDCQ